MKKRTRSSPPYKQLSHILTYGCRRMVGIAAVIVANGTVTHRSVVALCGCSRKTASSWLARMAADGIVEQTYDRKHGASTAKCYVLTEDGRKWLKETLDSAYANLHQK